MAYIQLNVSEETAKKIHESSMKFQETELTDELLQQYFKESLKQGVKSSLQQMFQTKEFRNKLADRIMPLLLAEFDKPATIINQQIITPNLEASIGEIGNKIKKKYNHYFYAGQPIHEAEQILNGFVKLAYGDDTSVSIFDSDNENVYVKLTKGIHIYQLVLQIANQGG